MGEIYSNVDLSRAFVKGHNDGWAGRKPKPAPRGVITDQKHQKYLEGHKVGVTARYWFDKGVASVST